MNSDVRKVISAELLKLQKRRTTVVVPLLVVVLSVVMFFGLELAARRDWIGMPSGFYLASRAIGWMADIVVLLAVVMTCFHISREFALGTVRSAWVQPITRRTWYTGKILSACAAVCALFLLAVVAIVVLSAVRFGFVDLMEKDYLLHSGRSMGWRLLLTIIMTLWALLGVTVVMAMVAAVFNHPGGAIAAGLGLALFLTIIAIFPPLRPYLLNTFLSLPTEQMVAMSKGLPLPLSWNQLVLRTLVGTGVWMVLALIIGYRVIIRKEVTW